MQTWWSTLMLITLASLNALQTADCSPVGRNSRPVMKVLWEFLTTGEQSAVCRAFKEASVISISVDHQVCIHHVPELPTVSSVTAMLMVIFVLVATFVLSSFLGL